MANNCYFEMKIVGKKENVQELVEMMQDKYFAEDWYGRLTQKKAGFDGVFSFNIGGYEPESLKSSLVSVAGKGFCSWSLKCALRDYRGRHPSLESESKRLGLVVEAYSSEPGFCFQEHIVLDKGSLVCEECIDYEEHWVEGMSERDIADLLEKENITKDELMKAVNDDGDYCVGGFGDDFGNFENLFGYFKPELRNEAPVKSLNEMISAAEQKAEMNAVNDGPVKEVEPVRE